MKLIIQIPCYNESKSLPQSLPELPREIPGITKIEWLVVDDGSEDNTIEVAKQLGVDHIVKLPVNQGLAKAFSTGLETAISLGADIIVNTDADNQYNAAAIPSLIYPLLNGKADIAIGARPIESIKDFSYAKKILQRVGSSVVRKVSKCNVIDAPSGFRAYTRDAAMKINVFSSYTYTLETIIQAGQMGLKIENIPVEVNPKLRQSRLVKSSFSYIRKSILTLLRIYVTYKPMRFFFTIAIVLLSLGILIGARFLYFYFTEADSGKIQSLILAAILLIGGVQMIVVGILSDLLSVNRKLLQNIQYQLRKSEQSNVD